MLAVSSGRDDAHTKHAPTMIAPDEDDDDLFELNIDLLGRRLDHHHDDHDTDDHHRRRCSTSHFAAVTHDNNEDDGRATHALLANCLLPVSAVSNAVPVAGGGSTSYLCAGYYGSKRLFPGGSSKRFLFGRSARFGFSPSRGFQTMGTYFQR